MIRLNQVLSSTLWGFAAMYVIWSECPQKLPESQRQTLKIARSAALEGYHWMSLNASENNRYAYLLRPKFHKLDELLRLSATSRRNFMFQWTMCDEDWIGRMVQLASGTRASTTSQRVSSRWGVHITNDFQLEAASA